jgi:hypothetical protein
MKADVGNNNSVVVCRPTFLEILQRRPSFILTIDEIYIFFFRLFTRTKMLLLLVTIEKPTQVVMLGPVV